MQFEKQEYQQDCIDNIISLLKDFDFKKHDAVNLKKCFEDFYNSTEGKNTPFKNLNFDLNVDVLMETGTGKTFTYLNLIFELNKVYRQNKFIIFVPRKAILESVKQNIKLTKDYFYMQYAKHLKTYYYNDSKSLSNIINHYIKNTDEFSVLVLTNSSIDKGKKNLLNQQNESLFSDRSILQEIISLNPISIIDEPHLLKGEKFYNAFKELKTLYFRFGATFPKEEKHKLSNLVYTLDSISAFNTFLVKQIYVHTLCAENQIPSLINMDSKNKKGTFSYFLDGIEYKKDVFYGEDLGVRLHYPAFNGVELLKITSKDGAILSNQTNIPLSKNSYRLNEYQIRELISLSIDLHFKKEQMLFKKNIKALSLFFIPDIESFRGENPFIKNEFERIYKQKRMEILKKNLSLSYREYLQRDFDDKGDLRVHQGYFSGDIKGNNEEKEAQGVRLILEEKEKLLNLNEPLRFIFSVWALQEGWDNPNIFTLTKLASSSSEISAHQQIGRGLRLCVNNEGRRVSHNYLEYQTDMFYNINHLDVLVSGEEKGFIEGLQKEIQDSSFEFKKDFLDSDTLKQLGLNERQVSKILTRLEDLKVIVFDENTNSYNIIAPIYDFIAQDPQLKELLGDRMDNILEVFKPNENKYSQTNNANKKKLEIPIKSNLAKEFKKLWDAINAKAKIKYENIQMEDLIKSIALAFNQTQIPKEHMLVESKYYDSQKNKIITKEQKILSQNNTHQDQKSFITQNLLEFAKKENLPLSFMIKLYNSLDTSHFINNPKEAFKTLKTIIKEEIHKSILHCVSYHFETETKISNDDLLFDKNGEPRSSIESTKLGKFVDGEVKPQDHYLYETCVYDSNIEKEVITKDTVKIGFEDTKKQIKVFAKLPKFSIPTPYKEYYPDFAYLIEDTKGSKIFFVCETKGYDSLNDISIQEKYKIDYARKFFEDIDKHLKDIRVVFEPRINKQNLIDVIAQALQRRDNDRQR
ncbi:DEAD/DEAH box helicase family protein [Helicobacter cappadocius]|uniref:DEAD/DEAH box helicase family protein n=1 Tax=Helicobacter cappadocius TaxID=3063998 RepID=A0AA90T531_9HELI|nr:MULTISPECIES: DEAD/DEAH box helicase family protein [unclassified Helicobacter]MDO7253008.1 DEAD/DEAH box helicase family protein [Helicobacter sp. faydin-H75]MDP2539003.1 DEAD/DEAH box helicase family protein [Helicobacter sp. faydin-H76]